jgi:predicted Fe-Mo cluster-binding NifX family protein
MRVCVPVTPDGQVDHWGRARRVAIATVEGGAIRTWQEFDVGWDQAHDSGPEGAHHARIARFVREHAVEIVAAGHMGPPMAHLLERLGIAVRLGVGGDAHAAVIAAGTDRA